MVDVELDNTMRRARIVLRPNRSWTWRANAYLVATLLAVSGMIGAGFAAQGLWMVLPFTALEIGVLTACLYYCVRRTHRQEVLTFSASELIVEQGHRRPERTHRYERFWTRVCVEPASHPWYSERVAVQSRGQQLEIGSFLNPDEKKDLIRHIRLIIRALDT